VKYLGPLPGGAQPVGVGKTSPVPPLVPALPPARTTKAPPLANGSCPAAAPIKGNVGAERIYHLPGDPVYTRTPSGGLLQQCHGGPDGHRCRPPARRALVIAAQALLLQDAHFRALKTPVLSRCEVNAGLEDTAHGYL